MVLPIEQQLGPITILDEDSSGTVTASGANIIEVYGVIHDANGAAPTTVADEGAFWVENTDPTLPKFTDSDGITITLGQSLVPDINDTTITVSGTIPNGSSAVHRVFLIDTASGAITVDLPLIPISGEVITIKHWLGNATINNIFIDPNGFNIDGAAIIDTISNNREALTYQYDSGFSSWILR